MIFAKSFSQACSSFLLLTLLSLQITGFQRLKQVVEATEPQAHSRPADVFNRLATAQAQQPTSTPKPPAEVKTQKVKLAYQQEATKITAMLKTAAAVKDSVVFGLLAANIKEDEIVLTGTPSQIKYAVDIIAALDQPSAIPARPQEEAGQRVKLYYLREAGKIKLILNGVADEDGSALRGLKAADVASDELILYGPRKQRENASRIIAALDLPRPGVRLEMWGIQLSSAKPEEMDKVMQKIRVEIDQTQQAVRETYALLQRVSLEAVPSGDLEAGFKDLLEDTLQFQSALDQNRPLAFTDILLRLLATKTPVSAAQTLASSFTRDVQQIVTRRFGQLPPTFTGQPFERFFHVRKLVYANNQWRGTPTAIEYSTKLGRSALLEFAFEYSRLVHDPDEFSPYYLQRAADTLNTRLQENIDALNLDIQELFVAPTLERIRTIVGNYKQVEFAQVGKTSIATLSGIATEISAHSVSAFDVTPPLRLSELLKSAHTLANGTDEFIPDVKKTGAQQVVGTMPLAQVIGLLAAFGENREIWRELRAGISLKVTPNVLRTMTSAELQIDLQTGDPQGGTRESGVRPLSRISQHDLKTNIYLNALDFFDLSAFVSQSTMDGGRGYVPLLGPIWMGLFSDIPALGTMFSWKKGPKTVYHQSLVLTNSFISPTVMGIAYLYPTTNSGRNPLKGRKAGPARFSDRLEEVRKYTETLETLDLKR